MEVEDKIQAIEKQFSFYEKWKNICAIILILTLASMASSLVLVFLWNFKFLALFVFLFVIAAYSNLYIDKFEKEMQQIVKEYKKLNGK